MSFQISPFGNINSVVKYFLSIIYRAHINIDGYSGYRGPLIQILREYKTVNACVWEHLVQPIIQAVMWKKNAHTCTHAKERGSQCYLQTQRRNISTHAQ